MTNDKQRLRSIIGPCVSGCREGLLKKTEVLNLQTERYAQREMEGGGGGGREMNSSPKRGRWNLRENACKGDDIVVFVPFYKFTVKLLIGLS